MSTLRSPVRPAGRVTFAEAVATRRWLQRAAPAVTIFAAGSIIACALTFTLQPGIRRCSPGGTNEPEDLSAEPDCALRRRNRGGGSDCPYVLPAKGSAWVGIRSTRFAADSP